MFSILPVLLEFLPELAGLVAGGKGKDIATIGAKVAKEVLGTDDPNEVAAKLSDPQTLEAFKLRLEQETEQFRLQIEDVQDARKQTVELVKADSIIAWGAVIVSGLIVAGYFFCIWLLFIAKNDMPLNIFQLLNVLFGTLSAAVVQVCNYWLGSSSGSAKKDNTIGVFMQQAAVAKPPVRTK